MATTPTAVSQIQSDIRSANDTFEQTFARGDAPGMALLYTPDGMLLPTGVAPVVGHEAIGNFWQMVMDMGVKAARLDTVEVEEHGDTAIELGHYLLSGEGRQRIDQGKYLVIWKKQNGQWKLHKDIWNTSVANA
jgi:uncharacterized protein (TIGR02246 family)